MKRIWENISEDRVWRRVNSAPQIWSLCLFAIPVFYLSWGIRFLLIVEPPAIRYCIRGFLLRVPFVDICNHSFTCAPQWSGTHTAEVLWGFLWGLAWQLQLYVTVVFIVGSFVRADWLYAIFVFTKKAVLSHVCFKIKKPSTVTIWKSAFASRYHMGGCLQYKKLPLYLVWEVTLMTWADTLQINIAKASQRCKQWLFWCS